MPPSLQFCSDRKKRGRAGIATWSFVIGGVRGLGYLPAAFLAFASRRAWHDLHTSIRFVSSSVPPSASGTLWCTSPPKGAVFHSSPNIAAHVAPHSSHLPLALAMASCLDFRYPARAYLPRHGSRAPLVASPAVGFRLRARHGHRLPVNDLPQFGQ